MSKTFLQKNFVYYIFYHQLTVCKCFVAVFITKITAKKFGFYHRKPHYSCAEIGKKMDMLKGAARTPHLLSLPMHRSLG